MEKEIPGWKAMIELQFGEDEWVAVEKDRTFEV
jgi:hypothetical protein